jgi:5-formyltetrahydrofolate cyclo-ligase
VEDFFQKARARLRAFEVGRGPCQLNLNWTSPLTHPRARKTEIRRQVVARILAMDPEDRRFQEAKLARRLEGLPGFATAGSVLLYASAFPEEIDTQRMLRRSLELGKRLILPRVDRPSRSLKLFEVADLEQDLLAGHKGIPEPRLDCPAIEPSLVDWVLVPGLAFDKDGQRLGRGAGHYDRLLPTLRAETPRWALILDVQWEDALPLEPHDQPLDGVADFRRTVLGRGRNGVTQ